MVDPRLAGAKYEQTRAHIDAILAWAEDVPEEERDRVRDAVGLMVDLHLDQPDRPGPQPYVEHTAEVAHNVILWTQPTRADAVIAACLHDAVEDQGPKLVGDSTLDELEARAPALEAVRGRFGDQVAHLVDVLTNPDIDRIVTERHGDIQGDERRARKNEVYTEHVLHVFEHEPEAAAIKLGDFGSNALRLDRVDTTVPSGKRRKEKLVAKYRPTLEFLLTHLGSLPPEHPLASRQAHLRETVRTAYETHFRSDDS